MSAASPPERVAWAVERLDVRPTDHVLEIGCGPGHAVALVAERLTSGTVTAIDRSATMVARACARNAAAVADGRARIERQELASASLGRRFAKVFAIDVNAFWTAPAPNFAALAALLAPDGTAHLVYAPPTAERLHALRRGLPAALEAHGFEVLDATERAFRAGRGLCIVGRAPRTPHGDDR